MNVKCLLSLALVAATLTYALDVVAAPLGDSDKDGKLALVEYQAMIRIRMLRADTSADGKISFDEWKARPAAAKAKRDPAKAFNKMDGNDDGFIDASEIDPLLKRRFDRIDANADGKLSAEELSARNAAAKK